MNPITGRIPDGFQEVTLPDSCATCDGPLTIRVSSRSAVSWCPTCCTIARPSFEVIDGRIRLEQHVVAEA